MTEQVELEVGPVAHGGHCVARHEGRVVFVRHALPGERVRAQITETKRSYLRADAVEVLRPSPDRVAPPCPYAGPGACGGCDFQHVRPQAQRRLKATVVAEQMARLGGLSGLEVTVEELPGGSLGWRTRQRYAVTQRGEAGLRRHRSHRVIPVDRCLLTSSAVDATGVTRRRWPDTAEILVAASSSAPEPASKLAPEPTSDPAPGASAEASEDQPVGGAGVTVAVRRSRDRSGRWHVISGDSMLTEHARGRVWRVAATGFWQVHPAAADTLAQAVVEGLQPQAGERCLDLYAGAGLFAGVLGELVGASGQVTALEGGRRAAALAVENLSDLPQVSVRQRTVSAAAISEAVRGPGAGATAGGEVDLVVVDPPRTGAGREVVEAIVAARPRGVSYVACDPASLARDVALFRSHGYELAILRAFDLFPMTHHVECVATLARPSAA